jgi:hypothetical protein
MLVYALLWVPPDKCFCGLQKDPMTQEEIEQLVLELNKIGVSKQLGVVHLLLATDLAPTSAE